MPEHDPQRRRCRVPAGGGRAGRTTLTHRGRQKWVAAARRNSPGSAPPRPVQAPLPPLLEEAAAPAPAPRPDPASPPRLSGSPPPPPSTQAAAREKPVPSDASAPARSKAGTPTHHQQRSLRCPARGGAEDRGPLPRRSAVCTQRRHFGRRAVRPVGLPSAP